MAMSTGFIIFLLLSPAASLRPVAQRRLTCTLEFEGDQTDPTTGVFRDFCGKHFEVDPTTDQATEASQKCLDVKCLCADAARKRWLEVNDKFAIIQKCGDIITMKGCKPECALEPDDRISKFQAKKVPQNWPEREIPMFKLNK